MKTIWTKRELSRLESKMRAELRQLHLQNMELEKENKRLIMENNRLQLKIELLKQIEETRIKLKQKEGQDEK